VPELELSVTELRGEIDTKEAVTVEQAAAGCSAEQAHAIQRQRAAARLAEIEEPASNVVYGVDFRKGRA
jgi:hypothetical protein